MDDGAEHDGASDEWDEGEEEEDEEEDHGGDEEMEGQGRRGGHTQGGSGDVSMGEGGASARQGEGGVAGGSAGQPASQAEQHAGGDVAMEVTNVLEGEARSTADAGGEGGGEGGEGDGEPRERVRGAQALESPLELELEQADELRLVPGSEEACESRGWRGEGGEEEKGCDGGARVSCASEPVLRAVGRRRKGDASRGGAVRHGTVLGSNKCPSAVCVLVASCSALLSPRAGHLARWLALCSMRADFV